jgi:hypothetical protein
VRYFGVPARVKTGALAALPPVSLNAEQLRCRLADAACSLPARTKQRSWGVKKACNLVCSVLTHRVNFEILEFFNEFMALSKFASGQLPNLGLIVH